MFESSSLSAKPQGKLSTAEIPLLNWSSCRQWVAHAEVTVPVLTHSMCEVVPLILSFCHLGSPGCMFSGFLSFAFFLDRGIGFWEQDSHQSVSTAQHSIWPHIPAHCLQKGATNELMYSSTSSEMLRRREALTQVGWAGDTPPWCASSGKGVGAGAKGGLKTWNRDIFTNPNLSTVWAAEKEINSIPARHSTHTRNVQFTKKINSSFSRPWGNLQAALQTSQWDPKPTCQFSPACRAGHFLQDKFCPNWWHLYKHTWQWGLDGTDFLLMLT